MGDKSGRAASTTSQCAISTAIPWHGNGLVQASAFALAYFLGAVAGKFISFQPLHFVILWFPSGLFASALLCSSRRRWPALILAASLANIGFDLANGQRLLTSLGFAVANCLEATTGAWLVGRLVSGRQCSHIGIRELLVVMGASSILSPALGAAVGATVVYHTFGGSDWAEVWLTWWSSDGLSVIVLVPFLLSMCRYGRIYLTRLAWPRILEFLAALAVLSLLACWVFGQSERPEYKFILLPPLLWMALRFRLLIVGFSGLAMATLSVFLTVHVAHGPDSELAEIIQNTQAVQLFLATILSSVMLLASTLNARQRAEEAMRESEERYRRIVETANEGVLSMDAEHRTTYVNEIMARMLGYSPGEMLGRKVEEFLVPENLEQHAREMANRHAGKSGRYEGHLKRKDGSEIWTQVSGTPILDSAGAFNGSFGMFTDITERKRAELEAQEAGHTVRALARELAMARERERRAIADDLHDGPVQQVAIATLLIEGLAREGRPFEEYAPCLGMLRNALQMLRFTIVDLSPLALKGTSLGDALDGLARDTNVQYSMEVQVSCETPDALTEESRALLYRASREFLVNAVKHGRASRVQILATVVGQDLKLMVQDNGVGFSSSWTNSLSGKHHGLANLKDLANSLGGKLIVDSEPGTGATVGIIMPLASLLAGE